MPQVRRRIGLLRLECVNPVLTRMKERPRVILGLLLGPGALLPTLYLSRGGAAKPRRARTRLSGAEAAEVDGAGLICSAGGKPGDPTARAGPRRRARFGVTRVLGGGGEFEAPAGALDGVVARE